MVDKAASAFVQRIFAVKETTRGVLAFPTSAAELVAGAGFADPNQNPGYTDSEEIIDSLDIIDQFQDQAGPGTLTIPTYLHPSGTAGSIPMSEQLLESLMGTVATVGGTSVSFTQAKEKPSLSIWVLKDNGVKFCRGFVVDKGDMNVTNSGGAKLDFSGGFMEMGGAGNDVVVGDVTADTEITVTDGDRFYAGGRIQLGSDTNTNAGYEIDSVLGDVLTMVDTVSVSDGAEILGFLPTGLTVIGSPIESRKTTVLVDGVSTSIKNMSLSISAPAVFQTDEITTSGFPEQYVEDRRDIGGSYDQLSTKATFGKIKAAYAGTKLPIVITIGNVAGSIVTINLPSVRAQVPSETSSAPTVSISTQFKALGSGVGENSCTIVFT